MATPQVLPRGVEVSHDGPVFHRELVYGPLGERNWIAGVVVALAMIAGAGAVSVRFPAIPVWIGAAVVVLVGLVMIWTGVFFRRLVLVVDREGISWSFGPFFTRRFRHDEITMFRARDFEFKKHRGWGVGPAYDGLERYEMWGHGGGDVLDIVVKRGATQHFLVSTAVPELVCAALVRAGGGGVAR